MVAIKRSPSEDLEDANNTTANPTTGSIPNTPSPTKTQGSKRPKQSPAAPMTLEGDMSAKAKFGIMIIEAGLKAIKSDEVYAAVSLLRSTSRQNFDTISTR